MHITSHHFRGPDELHVVLLGWKIADCIERAVAAGRVNTTGSSSSSPAVSHSTVAYASSPYAGDERTSRAQRRTLAQRTSPIPTRRAPYRRGLPGDVCCGSLRIAGFRAPRECCGRFTLPQAGGDTAVGLIWVQAARLDRLKQFETVDECPIVRSHRKHSGGGVDTRF
jgi:hypothetical protein